MAHRNRWTNVRSVAKDARGATYVEFLVAFFPVLLTFLGLWQFAIMCVAKLVVQHAAVCAARAGAVAIAEPQDTMHMLSDDARGTMVNAAYLAASPLVNGGILEKLYVEVPDGAGSNIERTSFVPTEGRPQMVRARVTAEFVCTVTPVNFLVCGIARADGSRFAGATKTGLVAEATFPYQGARFLYEPPEESTNPKRRREHAGSP